MLLAADFGGSLLAFFVKITAITVPPAHLCAGDFYRLSAPRSPCRRAKCCEKLLLYMGSVKSQAQYIVSLLYPTLRCLDMDLSCFVCRVLPVFAGFFWTLFAWFIHKYENMTESPADRPEIVLDRLGWKLSATTE